MLLGSVSTTEMGIGLVSDSKRGGVCTHPRMIDVDLLLCFHAEVYLRVTTCTDRSQRTLHWVH